MIGRRLSDRPRRSKARTAAWIDDILFWNRRAAHESSCGARQPVSVRHSYSPEVYTEIYRPPCDCWLSNASLEP